MAHLTYDVDGQPRPYGLDEAITTIGRLPDRDLQLLDRSVDKLHATVRGHRGGFVLEAHGVVTIGGRLVGAELPIALLDGDVIALGDQRLVFQLPRMLAHGVVPADLVGLPLGGSMTILRLEHTLDGERVAAAIAAAIGPGHGWVLATSAVHTELLLDSPGHGLRVGLELGRALRRLAGSAGRFRVGADLAPLDVARAGAASALAASDGQLVGTDSFTGRALLDASLDAGAVSWTRLTPDPAIEAALFVIASD